MSNLYQTDIALWAEQQAQLLRCFARYGPAFFPLYANEQIDWENIAREIQDVAKSEQSEIEDLLVVLCAHLLKWRFQPSRRSPSCRGSIVEARNGIARVIRNSPSLKDHPDKVLAEAYPNGRRLAQAEGGLTKPPTECPWPVGQMLQHDFWPEN